MMLARVRRNLALTPRFESADEQAFCERWMTNLEHYLYGSVLPLTAVIDVGMLMATDVIAHPTNSFWMRMTHAVHLILVVLTRLVLRRPMLLRTFGVLTALAYAIGYGYVAYRCHAILQDRDHELLGATGFLAMTVLYLQGVSLDKRFTLGFAVACFAIAVLAMGAGPTGRAWVGIYAAVITTAWFFHSGRIQRAIDEAKREFHVRGQIAPAHIVRKTGGDENELAAVFEPRERRSVCISSDWRNYQQMSGQIDSQKLASALNEYYDVCYAMLKKAFPEGNYYTDWIADELFIVIFMENDATDRADKAIVNSALRFAIDLVQGKEAFRAKHGLPNAIDVGLSTGRSLIGMMGPEGFRKATALGEVPGRARRLQSAGKLLRSWFGDQDRIVFDEDVLMLLAEAFDVKSFDPASPEVLRDLPSGSLFYVEPNGKDVRKVARAS